MNSNALRKVDFQSMEKTKSLIIVYYKGRRLSIPLAQSCWNLTRFLNNQISNFEDNILQGKQNKASKQKLPSKTGNEHCSQQIVCFQQKVQENSKNSILWDLKMNIILNFSRDFTAIGKKIPNNHQEQFYKVIKSWYPFPQFDITQLYKCIQIEPYFGENVIPMENKSQFGFNQVYKYKICSIMARLKHKNIYLARRTADGLFCVIKIIKDNKYLEQRNESFQKCMQNGSPPLPSQIINYQSFVIESPYLQNSFFTSVVEYCPGDNLEKYWQSVKNRQPFEQAECFQFLKQLFKAVYFMHTCKGLIHRQILLSKIFVGFDKRLRINSQNNMAISIIFKTKGPVNSFNYFQSQMLRGQLYSIGPATPPEVRSSSDVRYNSLVDYYNIGLVVYELLTGQRYNESVFSSRSSENSESQVCLINVLRKILSDNLRQRGEIVSQILSAVIMQYQQKGMVDQLNDDQIINPKNIFTGELIDQSGILKSELERQVSLDTNSNQEKMLDREFAFLLQKKDDEQNPYLNPMNKQKNKKNRTDSKDKPKSKSKTKTKSSLQKNNQLNSLSMTIKVKKNKIHDDKMSEASLDRSKHSRKSKKSKSHQKLSGESKQKPRIVYAISKPINTESIKKLTSKQKVTSKEKANQSKEKMVTEKVHLNNNINQYNVNPRSIGTSPKNIRKNDQGEIAHRNKIQQACKDRKKQEILEYEYKKYYQRQY